MAEAFGISKEKVLVVGQPRCDLLFEKTDFFNKHNLKTSDYYRIGIWLPTYRSSIVGDIRKDGEYTEGSISFIKEDDLKKLNVELAKISNLLIIKLHPMDVLQKYPFHHYSNIIILKQKDLDVQLYPLIGNCDYLLTDYSSVLFDFDVLKKPMAFVMNDQDRYSRSRGFVFENIGDALPGPILSTYEELLAFIKRPYYTESKVLFNKFCDGNSSKRLYEHLKL